MSVTEAARVRHAALAEGPALCSGMVLGPAQVYVSVDGGGYFLCKSPDGRRSVPLGPDRYPTPRAAMAARALLLEVNA